ncbi:hypothetical protein LPUS_05225 [Lasallia pustulata]|uniref:Uncharacterized protein n=1 Tax=Lasallia pustulata TaxID=136370 RepID=A0A1W5CYY2_9LECA|nr:hypothetical protein LPUS_05225 [Lasallia pustulata]
MFALGAPGPRSRITLTPCITEMLSTGVCPIKPTLLVDRVIAVTLPHSPNDPKRYEALYRIYLTDGEETISCLHHLVKGLYGHDALYEKANEGSYWVLDKYEVKIGKCLAGEKDIMFLDVAEYHEIGYQERFKAQAKEDGAAELYDMTEKEALRYRPTSFGPPLIFSSKDILEDLTEKEALRCQQTPHSFIFSSNDILENHSRVYGFVVRDPKPDDKIVGYIPYYDCCRHTDCKCDVETSSPSKNNSQTSMPEAPKGSGEKNTMNLESAQIGPGKKKRKIEESALQELSPADSNAGKGKRASKTRKTTKELSPGPNTYSHDTLPQPLDFYKDKVVQYYKSYLQVPIKHSKSCLCTACFQPSKAAGGVLSRPTPFNREIPLSIALRSLSQAALRAFEINQPLQPITCALMIHPLAQAMKVQAMKAQSVKAQSLASQKIDILAVISWVDSKTTTTSRVRHVRCVRLVDPSTPRQILLRVGHGLDFTPAVGTVALFRGVHWDKRNGGSLGAGMHWEKRNGGSLGAYDLDLSGMDWFIPNPEGLVGKAAVEELRMWWRKERGVSLLKERKVADTVNAVVGKRMLAGWCHDECMGKSVDKPDYLTLRRLGHCQDSTVRWKF